MLTDYGLILVLILMNGFFAAAEIAVVSAREVRLQTRAEAGDRRATKALNLQRNPGEFLATVQIGITLVGTLASAVGGVEAARVLTPLLAEIPWLEPYASQVALVLVVLVISYASLLLGELVPKRLAIRQPERWAMAVAGFFEFLSRLAALPIRFLLFSADLVMRLWRTEAGDEEVTSSEEIEVLVRRGTAQGIFLPVQERMIGRVFDYARLSVRDVMTPHTQIVALEIETSIPDALQVAKESGYSRFPVYRQTLDSILGYVHVKDLLWAATGTRLDQVLREMVFIPEGTGLPQASSLLTRARRYMGIVLDEFGGTDGLVTLEDIMEVVVGEIEDEYGPVATVPERGRQGEWCLSGGLPITEAADLLDIDFEPGGMYTTLAGFIMAELGEIPDIGDQVRYKGHSFQVEDMEGFRITSIRVQRLKGDDLQ